jgi:parallel beta-helix repeat protein
VHRAEAHAPRLRAPERDGNEVRGNAFSSTSSTGIRVDNGANTLLEGNTMTGTGGIAIDLNAPTSVTVRGNTVSG